MDELYVEFENEKVPFYYLVYVKVEFIHAPQSLTQSKLNGCLVNLL